MTNQEQEIMEILEEWDLTRCAWAAAELGSVTPRRSNSSSFFIEVGSRRVHLAGCTYNPSPVWVVQQAWNLAWKLQDGIRKAKLLLRDRDSKATVSFDEVFKSEGVEVIQLPFRAPRASAYSERWVRTVRWEVLDGMLIFGRLDLERACWWSSSTTTTGLDRTKGSSSGGPVNRPRWSHCQLDRWSTAIASAGSSTSTVGQPDEVTEKGLTIQV